MIDKVRRYIQSPQGRQNIEKAKRMARDPNNRNKIRNLLARFRTRGKRY
jgi:hypothetical protein